jgi:transcriptional regulator with XRE-family HTH domain
MDDTDLTVLGRRLGRTVRAHRTAQGRSLSDLARAAGLSKTILGRIEAGDANPSMETLWRVSQALQLPLGALLAEEGAPVAKVVRARSGEEVRGAGSVLWLIHAEGRDHRTEVYELELDAGTSHQRDPHLPGTEEDVLCLSGRVRLGPVGAVEELGPGDAIVFAADVPHGYEALEQTRTICWMLYPGTAKTSSPPARTSQGDLLGA